MAFEPQQFTPTTETPIHFYSHGFTPEEAEEIKRQKKLLDEKLRNNEEITLKEFEEIIVPFQRIHRTEEFILNPGKIKKEKIPKEPKAPRTPRVPKEKKLTKKQIETECNRLFTKEMAGEEFTEKEREFYNLYMKSALI